MVIHIDNLPVEVLEIIFSNLSATSLLKIGRVCKKWYALVIGIINRKKNFWKKHCYSDISQNVIEELLGQKSLEKGQNYDELKWKSIYKSWIRGQMISFWPKSKKRILAVSNVPISCIKLSGRMYNLSSPYSWLVNCHTKRIVGFTAFPLILQEPSAGCWLVSGHLNGNLCSWHQETGKEFAVVHHYGVINDFALIDVLGQGPYGSVIDKCTWEHHHIISVGGDHMIKVTPIVKYGFNMTSTSRRVHGSALKRIRVFDSHFVVSSADNTFSIWKMDITEDKVPIEHLASIIGPPEILRWISFWGQEIHCLTQAGKLCTYHPIDNDWTNLEVTSTVALQPYEASCGIRKAFLFRSTVIILLRDDGCMSITSDKLNFTTYPTIRMLRTTVISVALRGSILALGTENGKLLLYKVICDKDLTNLNLECPMWSKTLSEASIISIDIADNGEFTIIAACTNLEIFFFSWCSPNVAANKYLTKK